MSERSTVPLAAEVLQADGANCATLTPLVRAKIRELESGDVLEVRTDDPSAQLDIAAWCRLTGNELLAAIEGPGHTHFYLRKK